MKYCFIHHDFSDILKEEISQTGSKSPLLYSTRKLLQYGWNISDCGTNSYWDVLSNPIDDRNLRLFPWFGIDEILKNNQKLESLLEATKLVYYSGAPRNNKAKSLFCKLIEVISKRNHEDQTPKLVEGLDWLFKMYPTVNNEKSPLSLQELTVFNLRHIIGFDLPYKISKINKEGIVKIPPALERIIMLEPIVGKEPKFLINIVQHAIANITEQNFQKYKISSTLLPILQFLFMFEPSSFFTKMTILEDISVTMLEFAILFGPKEILSARNLNIIQDILQNSLIDPVNLFSTLNAAIFKQRNDLAEIIFEFAKKDHLLLKPYPSPLRFRIFTIEAILLDGRWDSSILYNIHPFILGCLCLNSFMIAKMTNSDLVFDVFQVIFISSSNH